MTHAVSGSIESEHPSLEMIADAAEDLLTAEQADQVALHLDRCADCAALAAALTEACEMVADSPAPPMPDAVFDRLTAVVRAESQRRASGAAKAEAEADAAAAVRRTALGTFGENPAMGTFGETPAVEIGPFTPATDGTPQLQSDS